MNEIQLSRYFERARAHVEEGKLLHATQIYRRLISEEPHLPKAYLELASIYEELDNYAAAEQLLLKAWERCGQLPELVYRLGNLHLRCERYERAISYYSTLENSKLPHVHFNLGVAYFHLGNLAKSEKHLRLTLKYDPHFPRINETIGDLLIRKKAYSEAVKHLRRGIEIDPYSSMSHYLLGLAYSALYDWKNAYEEFVTAIEMDPKEARAWEKCGEVLLNLQQLDEAESYLKKAIELDPELPDAIVDFGYLSLRRGQPDEAMSYFTQALKLEPHHARAIEGRIQVKVMKRTQVRR
jgi:tetratricopeptide (TPR) repeat protein